MQPPSAHTTHAASTSTLTVIHPYVLDDGLDLREARIGNLECIAPSIESRGAPLEDIPDIINVADRTGFIKEDKKESIRNTMESEIPSQDEPPATDERLAFEENRHSGGRDVYSATRKLRFMTTKYGHGRIMILIAMAMIFALLSTFVAGVLSGGTSLAARINLRYAQDNPWMRRTLMPLCDARPSGIDLHDPGIQMFGPTSLGIECANTNAPLIGRIYDTLNRQIPIDSIHTSIDLAKIKMMKTRDVFAFARDLVQWRNGTFRLIGCVRRIRGTNIQVVSKEISPAFAYGPESVIWEHSRGGLNLPSYENVSVIRRREEYQTYWEYVKDDFMDEDGISKWTLPRSKIRTHSKDSDEQRPPALSHDTYQSPFTTTLDFSLYPLPQSRLWTRAFPKKATGPIVDTLWIYVLRWIRSVRTARNEGVIPLSSYPERYVQLRIAENNTKFELTPPRFGKTQVYIWNLSPKRLRRKD
jgi:hypothetical protein